MKIESEDPVLTNGFMSGSDDSDLELETFPRNDYLIFNDNLFEGEEYTLDFYTDKIDLNYYTFHFTISLLSITEDLYNYYYSVSKVNYIDETINEPVVVFNNIQGGLGIAGGVNEVPIFYHENKTNEEV